jgi:hypothetical protein
VQDWNLTFEKEVSRNTVARLSYVGNHVGNLEQYYQYNNAVPAYIWYVTTGQPLPTGTIANTATRPFDKTTYGTIEEFQKIGWSNWNGIQMELERRYWKGISFQLFYVMGNAFTAGGQSWSGAFMYDPSQYLPGAVPTDFNARNRFLNYNRDTTVPKHRVRWNWLYDLPVGRGKPLLGSAHGIVGKVIGGWQIAGLGSLNSTYFTLPTSIYPNGNPIQIYGYQYPIQDCRTGTCHPGYLWWNGYISPNQINSTDPKTGLPNGVEGVPTDYKPAGGPLIPAGTTAMPANAPPGTNVVSFWNTNTVWIPLSNGTVQRIAYNNNLHPGGSNISRASASGAWTHLCSSKFR